MRLEFTKPDLKLWLRAANPWAPIRGMAEAQRAARIGSLNLGLTVILGLGLQLAYYLLKIDLMEDIMQSVVFQQDPYLTLMMQEMVELMGPIMVFSHVTWALIVVLLAYVQWKYMTWIIPAAMLGYQAYGLVTALIMSPIYLLISNGALLTAIAIGQVVMLPCAILWAAALRGGLQLQKLKRSY